ncbi:aminoglycoside 3'-phosphotransferase [Paenibacillus sp. TRM 82003]|uniref:aminoglycoside 3'-phosphotransferase n=1 Tax=Kineococcus sp. TRM81007 TaxID=2925831 RepID=UPI001F58FBEA|nr:aminoglycoside 3'-phosphotransferase [Kineococcus sp. TRM81007]MCI2237667.1 aminoglycoside 3'-phosphotransferase [Kineococcus sp. TRM81007]MCI3921684.1 aminoglycoside 3'-phosphotransferase [Paenibacillus sp. TRM 82003]
MSIPDVPLPVPPAVRRLAGAARPSAVWVNQVGGTTFRLDDADGTARFCKWAPAGAPLDLAAEVERLAWAGARTAVPRVLGHGADEDGSWLLTEALPGEPAVAPRWLALPGVAVPALARGLRALHERLPVASCPFDWSVPHRLARAVGDVARLGPAPPVDRLVVCHGDACAPNTLLGADGEPVAHVDLGGLGVADRWADLAVATMSLGWNYGPGWEDVFLDAYGVEPDPVRTAYYRGLWDAGP